MIEKYPTNFKSFFFLQRNSGDEMHHQFFFSSFGLHCVFIVMDFMEVLLTYNFFAMQSNDFFVLLILMVDGFM